MLHWYLARCGLLRTGILIVHVDSPAVLGHGRDGIGRNRRGCRERDDERCQDQWRNGGRRSGIRMWPTRHLLTDLFLAHGPGLRCATNQPDHTETNQSEWIISPVWKGQQSHNWRGICEVNGRKPMKKQEKTGKTGSYSAEGHGPRCAGVQSERLLLAFRCLHDLSESGTGLRVPHPSLPLAGA